METGAKPNTERVYEPRNYDHDDFMDKPPPDPSLEGFVVKLIEDQVHVVPDNPRALKIVMNRARETLRIEDKREKQHWRGHKSVIKTQKNFPIPIGQEVNVDFSQSTPALMDVAFEASKYFKPERSPRHGKKVQFEEPSVESPRAVSAERKYKPRMSSHFSRLWPGIMRASSNIGSSHRLLAIMAAHPETFKIKKALQYRKEMLKTPKLLEHETKLRSDLINRVRSKSQSELVSQTNEWIVRNMEELEVRKKRLSRELQFIISERGNRDLGKIQSGRSKSALMDSHRDLASSMLGERLTQRKEDMEKKKQAKQRLLERTNSDDSSQV